MRAVTAFVGLLSLLPFALVAQENPSNISGGAEMEVLGYSARSQGWAENFNTSLFGRCSLAGAHEIREDMGGTVASAALSFYTYSGTVESAARAGRCYRGIINASCDCSTDSNSFQSGERCAERDSCQDFNQNNICDHLEAPPLDPAECGDPCTSPIVLNLEPGPYRLSGPDDPVAFDIDADGVADRITWTMRGSATAFLALDRNGNGRIDSGAELFGTATPLRSGARAANGFEALRELDSNADGLVTRADARWSELLLWTDRNHDGISQAAEIARVTSTAVLGVDTSYHWTGRRDRYGNTFRYESLAGVDGSVRPLYDVYFVAAR